MRCPFCRKDDSRVVDTRESDEGYVIKRRRSCVKCRRRFTTHERLEEVLLYVVKKDGRREPFDREKFKRGLLMACKKRRISMQKIDEIVGKVELEIHRAFEREVPSREIGDLIMKLLHNLDHVAYVRFASVYRDFKDVGEFMRELKPMLGPREGN